MKKITILEVWDPVKNEFVPFKQAIYQGLFNTRTYLFFDPITKKYYSISEAAQRGLFKSAIDLRPESLIVERVTIGETVALVSAKDPLDLSKKIDIVHAVSRSIIDLDAKTYRNLATNEVLTLNEAIDKDLVQVKIVKEFTEKITETLTEQKSSQNLGLIKRVESESTSSLNKEYDSSPPGSPSSIRSSSSINELNGTFTFERTKSINISKRIKKNDEEFAAGLISESNSKIIINQSNTELNPILRYGAKTSNPVIDLNEAIKKNLIILPDSTVQLKNIKHAIDLNSGVLLDFETACDIGIIDSLNRTYHDTRNNIKISLFDALSKKYVILEDSLNENFSESEVEQKVLSMQLNNYLKQVTENDIESIFNPSTGKQVGVEKAVRLGLYDKQNNLYIDQFRKRKMPLEEAIEKGMVVLKPDKLIEEVEEGCQFLHIKGVINPATKEEMELSEAISRGILDYVECEFFDPTTAKKLSLLEAYDKGYLITAIKKATPIKSGQLTVEDEKIKGAPTNKIKSIDQNNNLTIQYQNQSNGKHVIFRFQNFLFK